MEERETEMETEERKMEIEVGDCSLWHYLIFCEEFVNDECENDFVCWVCKEPLLGYLAFKCLECDFVQHKLCTQLLDWTKIDVEHDIADRHHLILKKEMENNGKEEEVCVGCGDVASGPTYRCSIPKCSFHLHTSCHQVSHAIQHMSHLEHPLILGLPLWLNSCDICHYDREEKTTLLYSCRLCDFDIDHKCASAWKIIDDDCDDSCDEHKFIVSRNPIPFTCEACGEETKSFACQCSICRVLTHIHCTNFPRYIKIRAHNHLFSRMYYRSGVKKLEDEICKICCRRMNMKGGAYFCQVCDYIVHMNCAKLVQENSTISSEATGFDDDYRRHLVYLIEGLNVEEGKTDIAPSRIHHHSHQQHELTLNYKDLENNERCQACMQFIISTPFYNCKDCNIFFHKRCAKIPETIRRRPFYEFPLELYAQPMHTDKLFWCRSCRCYRHGFFYGYELHNLDVQCLLIPETVKHETHEHLLGCPMIHCYTEICDGCGVNLGYSVGNLFYLVCTDCEYVLCMRCATLPLVARYRYHLHLLKLTYMCKGDLEECYCLICEEKRDPEQWFYSCKDCDFTAHIQCAIGSSLKNGNHEHPIILVKECHDSFECHLCETYIKDEMALECTQCKFYFHFKCYYF